MKTELVGSVHLIEGGGERIPDVLALLEKEGMDVRGNPDIYTREYRQFGIDEAREIRERAGRRALGGSEGARRIFVLACTVMTNEAQNALLKTLEESPAGASFFFIIPSPHTLLPTIRSRAQILAVLGADAREALVDAKKFLSAVPSVRLDMLKVLLEKDDDEKRDTGAIIVFLSSLESVFAKNVSAKTKPGIEAVYRARAYVGDKGALVKALLEQVALLSPNV